MYVCVCDPVYFFQYLSNEFPFPDNVSPIHAAFNNGLHYAALYLFTLLCKQSKPSLFARVTFLETPAEKQNREERN